MGGNVERWKGKKAGRKKDVKEKGRKVEKYGKMERQKGGKVKRWKGRKMESMQVEKEER
jgi:hypothetical protein